MPSLRGDTVEGKPSTSVEGGGAKTVGKASTTTRPTRATEQDPHATQGTRFRSGFRHTYSGPDPQCDSGRRSQAMANDSQGLDDEALHYYSVIYHWHRLHGIEEYERKYPQDVARETPRSRSTGTSWRGCHRQTKPTWLRCPKSCTRCSPPLWDGAASTRSRQDLRSFRWRGGFALSSKAPTAVANSRPTPPKSLGEHRSPFRCCRAPGSREPRKRGPV